MTLHELPPEEADEVDAKLATLRGDLAALREAYPTSDWQGGGRWPPPTQQQLPEEELSALSERYPEIDWGLSGDAVGWTPGSSPGVRKAAPLHVAMPTTRAETRQASGSRPASARARCGRQQPRLDGGSMGGSLSARSVPSVRSRPDDVPRPLSAQSDSSGHFSRPVAARCGGLRQPTAHTRSASGFGAGGWNGGGANVASAAQFSVCHNSKALAPPAAALVNANRQALTVRCKPPSCGGWRPASSGSRRPLCASHPPGYRGLSCSNSTPACAARVTAARYATQYLALPCRTRDATHAHAHTPAAALPAGCTVARTPAARHLVVCAVPWRPQTQCAQRIWSHATRTR
mmetsp:Transcript_17816/g.48117  ORF Transcript_17816/g.48117 Transcript_17816/m.48117 type:complete len:347 (-) Transcript_17816:663-1703(-)